MEASSRPFHPPSEDLGDPGCAWMVAWQEGDEAALLELRGRGHERGDEPWRRPAERRGLDDERGGEPGPRGPERRHRHRQGGTPRVPERSGDARDV